MSSLLNEHSPDHSTGLEGTMETITPSGESMVSNRGHDHLQYCYHFLGIYYGPGNCVELFIRITI